MRTFRARLALYPGACRDEDQRELVLVFAERYRDADGGWDRLSMEAAIGILPPAFVVNVTACPSGSVIRSSPPLAVSV